MRPTVFKCTILTLCLFLGFLSPVSAADNVTIVSSVAVSGTVTVKYTNGTQVVSSPLWTGSIPTSITPVSGKYISSCQYLTFTIQGLLPFDELKSDVEVGFAVWTSLGKKLASSSVWYSDWNPIGGPTMKEWLECDDWLEVGAHTLVVTTKQTLSTNGLVSRYVEGVQQFPFTINAAVETTTTTTTVAPTTTTTLATLTKSVKRGKSVSLKSLLEPIGTGKQTWSSSGGCSIKGKNLVAPKKAAICRVTLKQAKSGNTLASLRRITVVVD